jgi:hypothetical protein
MASSDSALVVTKDGYPAVAVIVKLDFLLSTHIGVVLEFLKKG